MPFDGHFKGKLGVIGAGVMGKALVQGLIEGDVLSPESLWAAVRTESSRKATAQELNVDVVTDYSPLLPKTDVILLCVKPGNALKVLEQCVKNGLSPKTLVISIVAGVTIADMSAVLSQGNPIIRAMPNTPCIVQQGMSVLASAPNVTPEHVEVAKQIFESVGLCIELDETHFDAVTALIGSGPAYFYLIMESLADGGVRVGLPRQVALRMVAQTALGSASMVLHSGRHPASLKDDVTTPAGCTIGALLTMEDGKIRSVLARAVEEATNIAAGLGKKPY